MCIQIRTTSQIDKLHCVEILHILEKQLALPRKYNFRICPQI